MANSGMKINITGAPEDFDALHPVLFGDKSLDSLVPDIEGRAAKAIATPVLPGINQPLSLKSALPPVTVTPSAGPSMARSVLSPITSDTSAPAAAPHKSLISRVAGVLGKIGEGVGNTFAPQVMAAIPGTQLHTRDAARRAEAAAESGATVTEKEAQAEELKSQSTAREREYTGPKMGATGYMLYNKDTGKFDYQEYPNGKPKTLTQAEADLMGMDPSTPEYGEKLKALGDIYTQHKNEHETPAAERPLSNQDAIQQGISRRFQVLNPNKETPPEYTLPANATQKDFDNIDKLMQQTETATATEAQRKELDEMRKQTMEMAKQRAADANAARADAKDSRDASREDRELQQGMKWVTYTDPKTGTTLAGPVSDAKKAQATDMAELQGSDVKEIRDARQVVNVINKKGDSPESQGILQLVEGLGKDKKLGIATSRLNKFLTEDVGAEPGDDPRIIALLDKGKLALTLAMKAHFGASGGRSPAMLQHFMDLANAGNMDEKTLAAGFKAVNDYMRDRGYIPRESGVTVTGPPAGATGKAPGSDGKMYYHDAKGTNLGEVK